MPFVCSIRAGTLLVNGVTTLSYVVRNVGADTDVTVNVTDDQCTTIPPTSHTHTLATGGNTTGSFTLQAGPKAGVTWYV